MATKPRVRVRARTGADGRSIIEGFRPVASFEAAQSGRRSQDMWSSANVAGPITEVAGALEILRRRSRWEIQNNGAAHRAVAVRASAAVGAGILPAIRNDDLRVLFFKWALECDALNRDSFWTLQRLVAMEMDKGGEIFGRFRPRKTTDGLTVPLQVQLLPGEFVPLAGMGLPQDAVSGIQFDGIGRPRTYWMYNRHPGETAGTQAQPQLLPIPADEVLHAYFTEEIGQVRGIPALVRAIVPLHDLHDYIDAELVKKKTGALFGIVVETTSTAQTAVLDGSDPTAPAEVNVWIPPRDPGALNYAPAGVKIPTVNPPTAVGGDFEVFMRSQYQRVSMAAGMPYELLTGDFRNVNDRLFRSVQLWYERDIQPRQEIIIQDFCRPVLSRFIDAAVAAGVWRGSEDEIAEAKESEWRVQPFGHVHPVQEAQADIMLIGAGLKTRSQAVQERGRSFPDVLAELAAEQKAIEAAGVSLSFDPRAMLEAAVETEKSDG